MWPTVDTLSPSRPWLARAVTLRVMLEPTGRFVTLASFWVVVSLNNTLSDQKRKKESYLTYSAAGGDDETLGLHSKTNWQRLLHKSWTFYTYMLITFIAVTLKSLNCPDGGFQLSFSEVSLFSDTVSLDTFPGPKKENRRDIWHRHNIAQFTDNDPHSNFTSVTCGLNLPPLNFTQCVKQVSSYEAEL